MSQFCNSYNGFSQFCLPLCVCLRSFPPLIFSCLPIQSWRSSSGKKASFVISAWFVCNAGTESACKWNPAVRSCFPTSCQIFSGVPNVSAQAIGGHMKKGRKGVKHMLPRNKETTFGNRDLFLGCYVCGRILLTKPSLTSLLLFLFVVDGWVPQILRGNLAKSCEKYCMKRRERDAVNEQVQ
jgi:hypothetical protein